jgi:hypothetical protein
MLLVMAVPSKRTTLANGQDCGHLLMISSSQPALTMTSLITCLKQLSRLLQDLVRLQQTPLSGLPAVVYNTHTFGDSASETARAARIAATNQRMQTQGQSDDASCL